jgi:hypothetical protein
VSDRRSRVAVAALIHPLFVLAVDRAGDAHFVEPSGAKSFVPHEEKIERQITQIGDEISVAA